MGKHIKKSNKGVYGFKLLDYLEYIVYSNLNTKIYKVEEVGLKGELFADIPKFNGEYMISNKGNIFRKIYNKSFSKWEYTKVSVFMDKFISEKEQGNGTVNNYLYANIISDGKSYKLWVGRTVAELFVPKPKYILFKDGLFESKIPIDQSKLRVCYKNNTGTDVSSDNIRWVFRNDVSYKGVTIGNNTLPKYNNNGERYVVYRVSDGFVKKIFSNIRDTGAFLGYPNANGDVTIRLCKGRRKTITDIEGDVVSCRKLSQLKNDTTRECVNLYESALKMLNMEKEKEISNKLF